MWECHIFSWNLELSTAESQGVATASAGPLGASIGGVALIGAVAAVIYIRKKKRAGTSGNICA